MKDYYSFARTSIGFSHISSKKPCQDYSLQFQNDVASVIVVSVAVLARVCGREIHVEDAPADTYISEQEGQNERRAA